MAKAYQYRPAFFEGFKSEVVEYQTREQLEAADFVKTWMKSGDLFVYPKSEGESRYALMCQKDTGAWVIAFIDDPLDYPVRGIEK